MAVQDPSIQRRRLRAELRKAREAAGMRQGDVAKAMDWSPSKLIRIEGGQVSISTNDLRALLTHYNIKDSRRATSLLELAKSGRGTSFYDQYGRVLKSGFRDYLAYEGMASVIRQWEPLFVPGLLQTEEYARAVLTDVNGARDDQADQIWAVRQHRQEAVHERSDPPDMVFVVDEAAIRRHVGRNDLTMVNQLRRLKDYATEPNINVRIMQFSAGANPGMNGNFILLEFDEADLNDLVHLESVDDITIKDDAEQIGRYLDQFVRIEALALSEDDSVAFIDQVIAEMADEGGEVKAAAPEAAVAS